MYSWIVNGRNDDASASVPDVHCAAVSSSSRADSESGTGSAPRNMIGMKSESAEDVWTISVGSMENSHKFCETSLRDEVRKDHVRE